MMMKDLQISYTTYHRRWAGIGLLETLLLLIVIAIILVATTLFYQQNVAGARVSQAVVQILAIRAASDQYLANNGITANTPRQRITDASQQLSIDTLTLLGLLEPTAADSPWAQPGEHDVSVSFTLGGDLLSYYTISMGHSAKKLRGSASMDMKTCRQLLGSLQQTSLKGALMNCSKIGGLTIRVSLPQ